MSHSRKFYAANRKKLANFRAAKPGKPSRLRWLAPLPILAALWLWPAYTLATVCLGGPTFLLAWFLWSARQFGREYDEERNFKH